MVLLRHGEKLYNGVKQLVAENLETLAKERIIPVFPTGMVKDGPQLSQESEILLKALKSVWDDHTSNMTRLGQILQYMVRDDILTRAYILTKAVGPRSHQIRERAPDVGRRTRPLLAPHPPLPDQGSSRQRGPKRNPI